MVQPFHIPVGGGLGRVEVWETRVKTQVEEKLAKSWLGVAHCPYSACPPNFLVQNRSEASSSENFWTSRMAPCV